MFVYTAVHNFKNVVSFFSSSKTIKKTQDIDVCTHRFVIKNSTFSIQIYWFKSKTNKWKGTRKYDILHP